VSGREVARGPGEIRGAVVVMAKALREGTVKTRLTRAYPVRDVVQLSECMLHDTLALVQTLPGVHVAVMCPAGDGAEIQARVPEAVEVVEQRGNGLAAALVSVFDRFVGDFRRVIAVDSDSPHLPRTTLQAALDLLGTHEVVVGPTEDGGYYLIGASAIHPRLFELAPLGTDTARDALIRNARALGLSVGLTEACYDVDLPSDLQRLAAELRMEPARAPRTAALLASWRPALEAHDGERAG
jgi:uncharacterized protein